MCEVRSEKLKINTKAIIFYIVFFLFILAFCTTATNYDYDLWARLIVGLSFFQTGHLIKHDILSYTPTHAWFDHEWGSGIVFYLVQHLFSSPGILLLQALLIFLTFFAITKIIKLRGVKTTSAYNFLFYYFAFSSFSYMVDAPVRCQLFSFLFFTLFIYILECSRSGKDKFLLFLPLIMIFWSNLHGGCIAGFGLIILYIIGEFFNKKPIKKYFLSLFACILTLVINPWGIEYIKLLALDSMTPRPLISEWSGLFSKYIVFKYLKFKLFALILILAELLVVLKQLKAKAFNFDKTKFLIIISTLFIAVQHLKMIPLATISMCCFLYDDFYTVFNYLSRNFFNKIAVIKDTAIYLLIVIFAVSTIKIKGFGPYLDWSRYPVRAVEFIKINGIKGKLLQDFAFGSYISYKLYPQNTIFMDGRYSGVYDESLLWMLGYFQTGKNGWDGLLKLFPPDAMLIQKSQAVCSILEKDKNWKVVFEDDSFIVLVRSNKAKNVYKMPTNDIKYYKKTLFDTSINFKDKI